MGKSPNENEPDIATQIMQRMVRMPPKHHEDMKVGGRQAKPSTGQAKVARPSTPSKEGR